MFERYVQQSPGSVYATWIVASKRGEDEDNAGAIAAFGRGNVTARGQKQGVSSLEVNSAGW